MHLDDEQLQRFLHGELVPPAARAMAEHMAECAQCRARLSEAERDQAEVYGLLRQVDHPPPSVDADEIAARARAPERGWSRWAAGILFVVAVAGVAYAAPGSPFPGWTLGVRQWIQGGSDSVVPPPPSVPLMSGLAVPPGDGLVILFESAQPRSTVRISLGEWAEVRVRGPSGGATFGSEADQLRVGNRDSTATFEVEIPREAPRVEIRVVGSRIFLKDGARIIAPGVSNAEGVYLLPLAPAPSQ